MSVEHVMQAQLAMEDTFLSKANVVGVAVGNKGDKTAAEGEEPAVVVLVQQKLPIAALSANDLIPRQIDGVRTDVLEVGYLRAYSSPNPRGRFRPTIPAGVSIGHFKITAGTFGAVVTDRNTGEKLMLSNNHVLANSNDASIGDAILQPGPTDGGNNPGDMVARLERFVRIRYVGEPEPTPTPPGPGPMPPTPPGDGGCLLILVNLLNALSGALGSSNQVTLTSQQSAAAPAPAAPAPVPTTPIKTQAVSNLVDCAVAKPTDPNLLTDDILNIGVVSGTKPATLGMTVRKMGRTTGFTTGRVTLLNATVDVAYGTRTARFTGQVITEAMSQGGDSGSLIVDGTENKAVGLLFAGSNLATIFNPIQAVLDALQVNI